VRELFILISHLLVTLAKLARPGGLGAVAAESLAVKQQLLIMKRARCRAPKLTPRDRLILGVCALFVSPKRLSEMKRRNPRFGCRRIAEQISRAFAIAINKDVVRRILIRHYRPGLGGDEPSWLSVIGHAKDSLRSVDFFRANRFCSRAIGSWW
jgi:putative transposase